VLKISINQKNISNARQNRSTVRSDGWRWNGREFRRRGPETEQCRIADKMPALRIVG